MIKDAEQKGLISPGKVCCNYNVSRNQLNQKLKLMVEAPRYVIYSNTPPHIRARWASAEDSTLNEGWLRFELVTSCHTMSRNQFNQKLKPIVEALGYVMEYTLTLTLLCHFV